MSSYGIFAGPSAVGSDPALGFLPLLAWWGGWLPLPRIPGASAGAGALQPGQDLSLAQLQEFKACANRQAKAMGYQEVPMGPLLGKTCGLALDVASSGCPRRDEVLAECARKGIAAEPLVRTGPGSGVNLGIKAGEAATSSSSSNTLLTALAIGVVGFVVIKAMQRKRAARSV